jgi:hypothetical protein
MYVWIKVMQSFKTITLAQFTLKEEEGEERRG